MYVYIYIYIYVLIASQPLPYTMCPGLAAAGRGISNSYE